MSKNQAIKICVLMSSIVLPGCSDETNPDAGTIGQKIGQNVTEFAQDDAQYVAFTFPPEMDRQAVKLYRIAMRSSVAESP